ncbi:MAG: ABC transporter permease [Lachnospiraceae bacterium]|nr:ABC transporter permease [Lachnospiraceae bacterium]
MSKIKEITQKNAFIWPVLGCIILYIAITAVTGSFSIAVLSSCAKLCVFAMLLALGQMIVVTSGDGAIDLSQRYILTLTAYISCTVMETNIVLGLIAAILVGVICALISSLINVYLRVPAMITTLATGYLFYTVILLVSGKGSSIPAPKFVSFVNTNIFGLNMMTLVCIIVAIVLWFVLYRTKYGHQLHAVGQKREAARLAGINVKKTVIVAFLMNGALCGLAGALCGAYCGGANQDLGTTYFLPSVAAAFVGGTNAAGGKSSVVGVSIGALMMTFMSTFLNAAKLDVGIQRLIQGAFLVFLLVVAVSDAGKKK